MKAKPGLTIELVKLGRVSRSGYYRFAAGGETVPDPDMDLRDAIQRALDLRPAAAHGRTAPSWLDEPEARLPADARGQSLCCAAASSSSPDSTHGRKVYPNLARRMVLTLDQLWVADLTYIRLREEFVFLAVILDAYSRRVIGWALDREDELTLAALRMALPRRSIQPGLVHHSDRGSQYASNDYTDRLKAHQIDISMSRKANPWDNATCESFMKTLKYEEVHRNEYRDLSEVRASIAAFLEKVYNQKRLHSALGYLPPAEFEANLVAQNQQEAAARQLSL